MTEPDKDKLTEVELEHLQRKRLMNMFMLVETYDDREAENEFKNPHISRSWHFCWRSQFRNEWEVRK